MRELTDTEIDSIIEIFKENKEGGYLSSTVASRLLLPKKETERQLELFIVNGFLTKRTTLNYKPRYYLNKTERQTPVRKFKPLQSDLGYILAMKRCKELYPENHKFFTVRDEYRNIYSDDN